MNWRPRIRRQKMKILQLKFQLGGGQVGRSRLQLRYAQVMLIMFRENQTHALNGRPLTEHSGQRAVRRLKSYATFDPLATIHVISPSSIDALRHCRLAGAIAGWDLHPLESAAFSRCTPITYID